LLISVFFLAFARRCLTMSRSRHHLDLPSFPTRRSSDLRRGRPSTPRSVSQRFALGTCMNGPGAENSALYRPLKDVLKRQAEITADRKSTRLNSSHVSISYAVFCLKKKTCSCFFGCSCGC